MKAFFWTYLSLGVLSIIINLVYMAKGTTTTTKPAERAWTIAISIGFYTWAAYLMITGATW